MSREKSSRTTGVLAGLSALETIRMTYSKATKHMVKEFNET